MLFGCAEDLFYLKFNAELLAASPAARVAAAATAAVSNIAGKWLNSNWNSGVPLMMEFRCGEITCNTMNVLSIRFKYWIKSDSDKMYNKIDRLMLLLAQPLCMAAGCSPIHTKHATTDAKGERKKYHRVAKNSIEKKNINNQRVSTWNPQWHSDLVITTN